VWMEKHREKEKVLKESKVKMEMEMRGTPDLRCR
jgi:hypothetical protein